MKRAENMMLLCLQHSSPTYAGIWAWDARAVGADWLRRKECITQQAVQNRGAERLGHVPSAQGKSRCCSHASSPLSTLLANACFKKGPRMGVYAGAMLPCADAQPVKAPLRACRICETRAAVFESSECRASLPAVGQMDNRRRSPIRERVPQQQFQSRFLPEHAHSVR